MTMYATENFKSKAALRRALAVGVEVGVVEKTPWEIGRSKTGRSHSPVLGTLSRTVGMGTESSRTESSSR